MTWILEAVRGEETSLWREFVAVYMFGSALECNLPDDVDLLLVHQDDLRVGEDRARESSDCRGAGSHASWP